MTITTTEAAYDEGQKGFAVVSLAREYSSNDWGALAALERRLSEQLERSPSRLLIDLSNTTYIGCEFLNVLLRCRARANNRNCRLAFCALHPLPESIFSITRLDALFEIYPARDEAIEAMYRPGGQCA